MSFQARPWRRRRDPRAYLFRATPEVSAPATRPASDARNSTSRERKQALVGSDIILQKSLFPLVRIAMGDRRERAENARHWRRKCRVAPSARASRRAETVEGVEIS